MATDELRIIVSNEAGGSRGTASEAAARSAGGGGKNPFQSVALIGGRTAAVLSRLVSGQAATIPPLLGILAATEAINEGVAPLMKILKLPLKLLGMFLLIFMPLLITLVKPALKNLGALLKATLSWQQQNPDLASALGGAIIGGLIGTQIGGAVGAIVGGMVGAQIGGGIDKALAAVASIGIEATKHVYDNKQNETLLAGNTGANAIEGMKGFVDYLKNFKFSDIKIDLPGSPTFGAGISEWWTQVMGGLENWFLGPLKPELTSLINGIQIWFSNLLISLGTWWNSSIKPLLDGIWGSIQGLWKSITNAGGGVLDTVTKAIGGVVDGVVGDGIISHGKIITTHPDDYIVATKNPKSMGGSINITINGSVYGDLDKLASDLAQRVQMQKRRRTNYGSGVA